MGACPREVAAEGRLRPRVTGRDRAVVHVVAQVGREERDRRQPVPRGAHGRRGQVGGGAGQVGEVHPRAVLARVAARRAHRRARLREAFGVARERASRREERGAEVGCGEAVVAAVVGDALGAPGEQRQVVGLARVGLGVRVGEARPGPGEPGEVGRRGVADDLAGVLVLHDDDQHVIGPGERGGCSRGARGGGQQSGRRERDEAGEATGGHGEQCGEHRPDRAAARARRSALRVAERDLRRAAAR